jgi:hypothetical protein
MHHNKPEGAKFIAITASRVHAWKGRWHSDSFNKTSGKRGEDDYKQKRSTESALPALAFENTRQTVKP